MSQQQKKIDAVLRQRRLQEAVGALADASSNDLLQEERLQEFGELFCRCARERCQTKTRRWFPGPLLCPTIWEQAGTPCINW